MNDLQTKIFECVRLRARQPKHWIDELAALLYKSKYALYKKIRGEICLSLDEVVTIVEHYDLPLDPLIRPGKALSFDHLNQMSSYKWREYVLEFKSRLAVLASEAQSCVNIAGNDLPFVHEFVFSEIAAFRFFMHQRMAGVLTNKTFSLEDYHTDMWLQQEVQEILGEYDAIATTEIWNNMMLDSFLTQMRFALLNDLFNNPKDAAFLYQSLKSYIGYLESVTQETGSVFRAYYLEYPQTDYVLFSGAHGDNLLLPGNGSFPALFSQEVDRAISDRWVGAATRHAIPLFDGSARERRRFFSQLRTKIDQFETEMEGMSSGRYAKVEAKRHDNSHGISEEANM